MEQKALTSPTRLVLFLIGEGPVVLSSAANYDNIMFNLKCCIIYSECDFVLFPDERYFINNGDKGYCPRIHIDEISQNGYALVDLLLCTFKLFGYPIVWL
jgi:hypothetical protein